MTTIEFRAPWDAYLRFMAASVSVAVPLIMLATIVVAATSLAAFLMFAVPPLLVGAALAGRVRGYVLTEDAITIRRGWRETRLSLAGLCSVTADVAAMSGSLFLFSNHGLFSYVGRYWNRKLGWYRAYATDRSRAVVLRYADRTVVISPHDPQQFIMRAGTFIKIAGFPK